MAEQNTETLKYPLEDYDYGARVVFTLTKDQPTGNISSAQKDLDRAKESKAALEKRRGEILDELKAEKLSDAEFKEQQALIDEQIEELKEQIKVYEGIVNSGEASPRIGEFGKIVSLYLPMGLQFRDNVTYENFDLGSVGAGMEAGMGFIESSMKGISSFVGNLTGPAASDAARLAGIQLAGKAKSFAAEIGAVQKLSGGLTLNPNTRVLFKQPNIREFSFTFKFVAKSKEEAEQVNQIIKFFRTELYPDEIVAGTVSLGYRFPNKFDISFYHKGKLISGDKVPNIKPCYLRDVSTTYNQSTMAMHADDNFVEIDMTLAFQEIKALVRKDVSDGGF